MAANRADRHVEGTRAPGDLSIDPAIAEDAEHAIRQLGPYRGDRATDRPLTLPLPSPHGIVEPGKFARQR